MDGSGATGRLVRPRHPAVDGELDLEHTGAVPVPGQATADPTGHPLADDRHRGRRGGVEHDDVGAAEFGRGIARGCR